MKIHALADERGLELRSSQFAKALIGGLIGVFGAGIGLALILPEMTSSGSGPGMFILHPLIFGAVGLYFVSTAKQLRVRLNRSGSSETRFWHRLGIIRRQETFDAAEVHHVVLHTDERISRGKHGSSRYRVSSVYLVLRDGREILVGFRRKAGIGGQQPLLQEAGDLARWLPAELHRTGIGAPPGKGATSPDDSRPVQHASADQKAGPAASWYNNPDSFGGVR